VPNTDADWEAFGRTEPYFGVLSHPMFKQGAARDEFFATGQGHVARLVQAVADTFDPGFAPKRALDFGCGVGRIAIPLSNYAQQVVGVDVSESMLAEATANCQRLGVENVTLCKSDDSLSRVEGSFDFLHSFIVFQHIPCKRGERIFDAMLGRLSDGGIGAVHFTHSSVAPAWVKAARRIRSSVPFAHNIINVIQRRPFGYPHMQMNEYDVNRLLVMLDRHGCHRVHVRFTNHGGCLGVFLLFRKETPPAL
jgi:SAM-dependent methyltransferase